MYYILSIICCFTGWSVYFDDTYCSAVFNSVRFRNFFMNQRERTNGDVISKFIPSNKSKRSRNFKTRCRLSDVMWDVGSDEKYE